MTYLQLVNQCLRRLREDEVASISANEYSQLVGDFVNDAKEIVENAYAWAGLRQDVDVPTSVGVREYSLSGVPSRARIVDVYNETTNLEMHQKPKPWFRKREATASDGSAHYYTFDGLDSNADIKFKVLPTPDAIETLAFSVVVPQDLLVDDNTHVLAPNAPILHLAVALLSRERGETGGTSAGELFQIAEKHLKDAIAIEAARHDEELIYYTV